MTLGDRNSSMNIWTTIGAGLATIIALCVATFLVVGAEQFWRLFGEPDLGPVSFEQLERRATPNDSLACPPDFCNARADVTTRLYQLTARELRSVFAKVIASEPRVSVAETNEATLTDRYIQRSEHLGFPDTIVVRFLDRADGRSTIALYSRSQLGKSDFGVNRARIERWLGKLDKHVLAVD
jgi:uncharacterized protein (DUF1499 family)